MDELRGVIMPKKWFIYEKDFTTYFLKELWKKGFWSKKWSDGNWDMKDYDCNIVTNKGSYHTEIKVIDNETITLKNFRPNQIKWLTMISNLWWLAIAVIYSKKHNNYVVMNFKDLL